MPTERRDLAGDQRGAVLVVGLFAAVFLVGLLYLVFGLGETVRHHERMGDAVDAGAYAVGVMHARAMNLAALANMVKLSVTALVTGYLAIMTGASLTIAWICSSWRRLLAYGWCIPSLVAILLRAESAYSRFEPRATAAVHAADALQATLRDDLPTIALLHANAVIARDYHSPVTALVSAPDLGRELPPMPIRPGSAQDLCERAFPMSFRMVLDASVDVPASAPRNHFIGSATAAILPYCLSFGARPYEMSARRLGTEPFQIRLAVEGEPLPTLGERGVRVAAHGREPDGTAAAIRDRISILGIAQSEYYFADGQDPDEMLWRMAWRARLRRWRLPGGAATTGGAIDGGYFHEVLR